MKIDELFETCELERKQSAPPVDDNTTMLNTIADKVEQVINAKLEEFNKSVNTADQQIDNSGDNAANNDNAGDSTGNNDGADSSAESE